MAWNSSPVYRNVIIAFIGIYYLYHKKQADHIAV